MFLGYLDYIDRKPLKQHLNQLELSLASAGHTLDTSSHEIVWNCVTRINILRDMYDKVKTDKAAII